MLDQRAIDKLRSRLQNGGILQSLFDTVLATFDAYERALSGNRRITSSVAGSAVIQHMGPSQHELHVVSRVFNIAELIEKILLDVPVPDLLRVQRVCRHFHRTINGTPLLSRKMTLARAVQSRIPLRTIRHVGEGQLIAAAPGFHTVALLRPRDWLDLEKSALLDDVFVAEAPGKGFMVRQTCFTYLERKTDPIVVSVSSGVKFKHVFAVLHDLFWEGSYGQHKCGDEDKCPHCKRSGHDDSHPIQIDACWGKEWEALEGSY
ncbi:hypothetical protein LTR85_002701 [Meristemomyces frigidus]|nr:hypothetical protein LTR85_002701 [Meristemomyces frigidus]